MTGNMEKWESFTERLQQIVRDFPEYEALLDNGLPLTYRDLWRASQALAVDIRQANPASIETIVALHLSKSSAYIVALLACWMAGAAFMPIDPVLPDERKLYFCWQAKIRVVLGASVPSLEDIICIDIDLPNLISRNNDTGNGISSLCPETLAYLIYTSGSTGKPKGVLVEHRGLVPMLLQQIEAFDIKLGDRSLFLLSISFDAAISDIGTALLAGACLVIEPKENLEPISRLCSTIRTRGITYIDIAPSLLAQIDSENMPPSLRSLVIGGEVCSPSVTEKWSRLLRLTNVYGPTEATICTSLGRCQHSGKPLIGQPLKTVIYRIIDSDMCDASDGELLIGGSQLARGYYEAEALTQAKFLTLDGMRFYRTGDHVRKTDSGEYEFLGRIDRQFKLHGQLIEPAEIEGHLQASLGIAQAIVLKRTWRGDGVGIPMLIAFIMPIQNQSLDCKLIAEQLRSSLPAWMIPRHFEIIRNPPLTVTGKVDLIALRSWPLSELTEDSAEKPMSDMEARVARIFAQVLQRSMPSRRADFFDLGGDSLATLILTIEAERNGLSITPALLKSYPRICDLASILEIPDLSGTAEGMLADELEERVAQLVQAIHRQEPAQARAQKPYRTILITGAAGFLGSRLLGELLMRTDARFMLILKPSDNPARRIEQALELHFPGWKLDLDRIRIFSGNLEKPQAGLNSQQWHTLSQEVDAIYHIAAAVNMALPLADLWQSNVIGTSRMLELALTGKVKNFHYASTLSVFVATERNTGIAYEDDDLKGTQIVYGGYAQSKWAAERLVRQISSHLPINIYRFGLITGDSLTGYAGERDFLGLFIRGLRRAGILPQLNEKICAVDITPVDYAAAAMAQISLNPDSGKTFHIANPKSLLAQDFFKSLAANGVKFKNLIPADWHKALRAQHDDPSVSAFMLALCRAEEELYNKWRSFDLFQATGIFFHQKNTIEALQESGLTIGQPSDALLQTYIQWFLKNAKEAA